jgi:glycosyltransferase involved in cell wall biosynthesis
LTDVSHGPPKWRGLSVLVVSPTPTHPQDHGNRKRIFEICSELKRQGAEIHFIYYAAEMDWRDRRPLRHEREMEAAWDSFHFVAPSRPLHEAAIGEDHLIDEWQDPALAGCVRWFCMARKFDAIIVNYTWLSFCFDQVPPGTYRILDTHDVFSDRRAMLEKNGLAAEFFHTTREEEAKAIARADLVWAIKPDEQEFFETALGAKHCLTMLHAEPEKGLWNTAPSKDGWFRAGIIGARNNVNRRNLEAFLDAAIPILENYIAPVKIVVAGGCADDFADLVHPNVEIMGRVADVADFYRGMDVILAPMQFSTGLKIKVSEALASGAPLLAHAHATEGYPVTEPFHALASFQAIARELAKLSFDRAALPALAAASHAVCTKIQRDVLSAIEKTRVHVLESGKPAMCIVVPLGALNKEALLFDQFFAAFDYLRFAGSVVIYVTGEAGKFNLEILRSVGTEPLIFVEPSLAKQLGEDLPDSWRAKGFVDVLQSREIGSAYFLCDVLGLTALGSNVLNRAYVRQEAVDLSGGNLTSLVDLLRSVTEVILISASAATLAGSHDAISQIAYGRNRPFVSFAQRHKQKIAGAGILVLGSESDLLVPALRELGLRLGYPTTVFDPTEPSAASKLASLEKTAAATAIDVEGARLVVDLTPGHWLSSLIGEGAMRVGVPVIECPRGTASVIRHNESASAVSGTIGGFLRSVARGLGDGAFRRALCTEAADEIASQTRNDGGWTWLWRDFRTARGETEKPARGGTQSSADLLFQRLPDKVT